MLAKQNRTAGKTKLAAAGVWILTAAVFAALAAAEEPAAAPEEAAVVQQGVMGQSIQTITFKKDMPIRDALAMLAQMYQKNIVPSAAVDGIVTVSNLYDVTFEEALQAILGTHKYEIKGNFIKVYTNQEFMQDKTRFEHAIIALHYINSEEARKLAEPLLSEFGKLGVTTAAPAEMQAGKGGDTLAVHDRLVVSDYPENIQKIRDILAEVDVEPLQVLLEVTVMEATLTDDTKFGLDWKNISDTSISLGGKGFIQSGFTPSTSDTGGLSVGVTFDNISALITAIETVSDITIMANPKILALNKQTGKIIIGNQDGYLSLTNVAEGGTSTQQVEFLESGTVLEYRPFIGRDGMIRMEIHPEQSSGEIKVIGGATLPKKSTTEVITNVMVQDGQTIVLGGLFKEQTTQSHSQVPVLGDIPVVGELFRGINDKSERVELIVLITPHIINTPKEADGADRLEDVMRLAHNARQNLYWMSRAKIEEDRYAKAVKLYAEGQPEAALAMLDHPYAINRNYLDEVRLKERIIRETQPDKVNQIERIMLRKIENEESGKWFRR